MALSEKLVLSGIFSVVITGGEPLIRKNLVKEILSKEVKTDTIQNQFESKIVKTEKELIELSNQGYECQQTGNNKWLMRRKISNITFNVQ